METNIQIWRQITCTSYRIRRLFLCQPTRPCVGCVGPTVCPSLYVFVWLCMSECGSVCLCWSLSACGDLFRLSAMIYEINLEVEITFMCLLIYVYTHILLHVSLRMPFLYLFVYLFMYMYLFLYRFVYLFMSLFILI